MASLSFGFSLRAASTSRCALADGEVVVVVLVGWIGLRGALVELEAVFALAAERDALVIDHLRQRKSGGHEGEGLFGGGVLGSIEARQAESEVGLQRQRVGGWDLRQCRRRGIVIALGVLLLAERQQRCGVAWCDRYGCLQTLEPFARGGCAGAANVVLEGGERDRAGRGEEALLGDAEVRVEEPGRLPGDGVFGVEEAAEFGSIFYGCRQAQVFDGENAGLDGDAIGS